MVMLWYVESCNLQNVILRIEHPKKKMTFYKHVERPNNCKQRLFLMRRDRMHSKVALGTSGRKYISQTLGSVWSIERFFMVLSHFFHLYVNDEFQHCCTSSVATAVICTALTWIPSTACTTSWQQWPGITLHPKSEYNDESIDESTNLSDFCNICNIM